jgi:hypothetical protein
LGAYQSSFGGSSDAFVTKLGSTGSTLAYSTYLGGSSVEDGNGIAVDASGSAYVSGRTFSTNFPTSGAYQGSFGGGEDAFVTKLGSTGSALAYSTYLGGSSNDQANGIAVDASGNAYVTGQARSTNFPTLGAYQSSHGGSADNFFGNDAFVTKLASGGSTLAYSTYLGGSSYDYGMGIAVDGSGNAYVTGWTGSTNFPTASAYQSSGPSGNDAFVTKLASDGSTLAYSTYLGGNGSTAARAIAVDASGNAYVTGETSTTNLATSNVHQPSNGGIFDAFVAEFSSTGSTLAYFTYLGGSNYEYGTGIAVDASGDAYVTGYTLSTNFPTSGAYQGSKGGGYDAFVTKISSPGSVTVTAPNGGENWCAGSTQSITWISSRITNVAVELSSDGGTNWSTIASSVTASASSYSWSIPASQADGSNYRVRVSDAGNSTVSDAATPPLRSTTSPRH